MKDTVTDKDHLYLGVDIGGTKVQASLVRESGEILQRERRDPADRRPGTGSGRHRKSHSRHSR